MKITKKSSHHYFYPKKYLDHVESAPRCSIQSGNSNKSVHYRGPLEIFYWTSMGFRTSLRNDMMQENVTIFDTFSRRCEDQIQPLQDGILLREWYCQYLLKLCSWVQRKISSSDIFLSLTQYFGVKEWLTFPAQRFPMQYVCGAHCVKPCKLAHCWLEEVRNSKKNVPH